MRLLPAYKHIINPNLKNIYLSLSSDGELIVKSPRVSLERIEKLIISKSNWINKTKEKIARKKGKPEFLESSINIYYLGKTINVILKESNRDKLDFLENEFMLFYSCRELEKLHKTIDRFYLTRAKQTLPVMIEKWSNIMSLKPTKIKFRKTKTQWGSCNSKNEIQLNTSLMKLPPRLIEYVVIHELSHIRHKHHQKSFWEEVGKHCPDFKACRKELKEFSV
ncbi:MAG: M48 family metallopeptidase [Epsilonproteobacteria bacterium]|nr:M48 family metallopeptidase [Campylobacterota bacterium]